MKRILWGQCLDGSDRKIETPPDDIILPRVKAQKLSQLQNIRLQDDQKPTTSIQLENPLVTQTIEVMNQTEMLQTLIDTYANKSGFNNYLLNPCQMIPQVDFPPENAIDLISEDKFAKPFWFIPPIDTNFSRGVAQSYPVISREVLKNAIRKSLCGLLRIAGFNDTSNNALLLFTDAVEEFFKSFLEQIKDVQVNESNDKQNTLDVLTVEKGYYGMTHSSLTSLHNYFKNNIISRNRCEINEFKDIYQEYDKMMKESQNMQKVTFKEDDYMSFLDFTGPIQSNSQASEGGNVNIMNLLETDNNNAGYKDIFETEIIDTTTPDDQMNFSAGPPSLEG